MTGDVCTSCGGEGFAVSDEAEHGACRVCWGSGLDGGKPIAATALSAYRVRFLNEHLATVQGFGRELGEPARASLMKLYAKDTPGFTQAIAAIELGRGPEVLATLTTWAREHRLS
jgi:hypothetical protein